MDIGLPSAAEAAGFRLHYLEEARSTNDLALKAALGGQDKLWCVADAQVGGRGRHGRAWLSPPGNLYASLALVAPCAPADAPKLGFVAGVALARAIAEIAPALAPRFRLKWPNDGLLDGMKMAGILLEGAVTARGAQAVTIGMGINIAHHPEGLDQPVTHLAAFQPGLTPAHLFAALAAHMADALFLFARGDGFNAICAAWQHHALPLDTPMRIRLPEGEQHGLYAGLNADGHLQLKTHSGITTILVGDVFLDKAAIIAFSSEVGTISCEENASKQRVRAYPVIQSSSDAL
jgi:BirA family transcriptional regulator, biotin operon repressor / biotin---[acetyl-CoA-carboxylase] ligase